MLQESLGACQDANHTELAVVQLPMSKPPLLPAFEPFSSLPAPLRSLKRRYDGSPCKKEKFEVYYPTPMPTSTTGVLPSSPPCASSTRPGLQRTISMLSERVPLGAMPTLDVPADGEPLLMGRSSNSSHYQLSANRLISRIHVKAVYHPPTSEHASGEIRIECIGWNGARVHCRGKVHELGKGETFSSDCPEATIMVEVQETRVLLAWPPVARRAPKSISSGPTLWEEGDSPTRRPVSPHSHFPSSPPPIYPRLVTPESPTPVDNTGSAAATFLQLDATDQCSKSPVKVYEDKESEEDSSKTLEPASLSGAGQDDPISNSALLNASQSSALSGPDDFSDQDEENDPIVHSFGPFGDNILPRMASINASSPDHRRRPLRSPQIARQVSAATCNPSASPVKNHVINQLAFSRLQSLPLSTILNNLPAELKRGAASQHAENPPLTETPPTETTLTETELRELLSGTPCVGQISREGKDAAGKPLEDEFYYVPEMDNDAMRRDAVGGGLGKTGLRAVRRQHKVSFIVHGVTCSQSCPGENEADDMEWDSNTIGSGRVSSSAGIANVSGFVSGVGFGRRLIWRVCIAQRSYARVGFCIVGAVYGVALFHSFPFAFLSFARS